MWNHGVAYDYYAPHHPEGVLALSAGLLMLGATMLYRAAKSVWEVGR